MIYLKSIVVNAERDRKNVNDLTELILDEENITFYR